MSVNSSYLCILDLKMRINWKLFSQLIEVSYGNCVFCLISVLEAVDICFPTSLPFSKSIFHTSKHSDCFLMGFIVLCIPFHFLKKNPNTLNALALTGLADPWRGTVNFCVPAMESLPILSSWWIELLRSSSILLLKSGAYLPPYILLS